jgi:hypothetical protein
MLWTLAGFGHGSGSPPPDVIRAGRTLVVCEATVSAVGEDQLVCVAMMLQTNCRVKMSRQRRNEPEQTFCEAVVRCSACEHSPRTLDCR